MKRASPIRQRRVAAELVKGVSATQALINAGYSRGYAADRAYRVIRQPEIQSLVTQAFKKVGLTMEQAIQPYLQGLKATIITRDKLEAKRTGIADPGVRMEAADRILKLMGQVPASQDYPTPPALPCVIEIHAQSARTAAGDDRVPGASGGSSARAADGGPAGSVTGRGGPTLQQAVIINVHSERERPR